MTYLPYNFDEEFERLFIVHQGIRVDPADVLSGVYVILHGAEIRSYVEAVLDASNGVWESTTCWRYNIRFQ